LASIDLALFLQCALHHLSGQTRKRQYFTNWEQLDTFYIKHKKEFPTGLHRKSAILTGRSLSEMIPSQVHTKSMVTKWGVVLW